MTAPPLLVYTLAHVAISLLAAIAGFVTVGGWMAGTHLSNWTKLFFITTTLTSATGFFFPFHGVTPALVAGIISLALLSGSAYANWAGRLAGGWRRAYVITAVAALYLNVFVLVVQLFRKIPALTALAPNQTEPPFAISQLAVLALFLGLGWMAVRRFPTRQDVSRASALVNE